MQWVAADMQGWRQECAASGGVGDPGRLEKWNPCSPHWWNGKIII